MSGRAMWGIVPAAGSGTRMQPLAFSKELLPVGTRLDDGAERPRAVSEYLVERLIAGGATKLCFIISPGKSDILAYYGDAVGDAPIYYAVQPSAEGLCDAIFRAAPLLNGEPVAVGLPDTVWFPEDALTALPDHALSFLLFPVEHPELFDAVVTNGRGEVAEIQVKRQDASSNWIWGAFKMPASVFAQLHGLWLERGKRDQYIGTLVNAWLELGGRALGIRSGAAYVDVGTVNGYREAIRMLGGEPRRALFQPRRLGAGAGEGNAANERGDVD
jgi:glucose-1-phosphate thymidylyltransferase